jgi:hypothetical protein
MKKDKRLNYYFIRQRAINKRSTFNVLKCGYFLIQTESFFFPVYIVNVWCHIFGKAVNIQLTNNLWKARKGSHSPALNFQLTMSSHAFILP